MLQAWPLQPRGPQTLLTAACECRGPPPRSAPAALSRPPCQPKAHAPTRVCTPRRKYRRWAAATRMDSCRAAEARHPGCGDAAWRCSRLGPTAPPAPSGIGAAQRGLAAAQRTHGRAKRTHRRGRRARAGGQRWPRLTHCACFSRALARGRCLTSFFGTAGHQLNAPLLLADPAVAAVAASVGALVLPHASRVTRPRPAHCVHTRGGSENFEV